MSELYHHGVLGMKWGVRNNETKARYQREMRSDSGKLTKKATKRLHLDTAEKGEYKYQKGDYIIPKGTTFKRLATNSSYGTDVNVYSTFKNADVLEYRGVLGRLYLTRMADSKRPIKIKDISMTFGEDVNVASRDVAKKEFKKYLSENQDGVKKLYDEYLTKNEGKRNKSKWYTEIDSESLKDPSDRKLNYLYDRFNAAMGMGSYSDNFEVIKNYQNQLMKKGYDGIADENDIKISTFKSQAPVILFNINKMQGAKVKIKDLNASDIFNAYNETIKQKTIRQIFNINPKKYDFSVDKKPLKINNYKLNSDYSLNNLADSYKNKRLNSLEIKKVDRLMKNGQSYEQASSNRDHPLVDKILKKYGV